MTAKQVDEWVDEPEPVQEDDFLAFWRTRQAADAPETTRILGVDVVVPTDIPLRVEHAALRLKGTQKLDEVRPLMTDLFGADHLDAWIANGLTVHMMKVILAWGVANGSGTPCTFQEAMQLAERAEAEQGKAPAPANRSARRASSTTAPSESTGRSSSRTSAVNTGSRRRKSGT